MDKKIIKILIYGAGAIGFHLAYIFDVPDVMFYIYMRKKKFEMATKKGIVINIKDNERLLKKCKIKNSEKIKFISKMDKTIKFDYIFFTHKLIGNYRSPFKKVSKYIVDNTFIVTPCTLLPGWWLKKYGMQKKTFFEKKVIAMTMWVSGIMKDNIVTIKHTQRGYPIEAVYKDGLKASIQLRELIKKKSISPKIKNPYSEIYLKVVNSFAFNLVAIKYELNNNGLSKNEKAIIEIKKIMQEIDSLVENLKLPINQSVDSRIKQTLSSKRHTMSMLTDFKMNKKVELFNQWKSIKKIKNFSLKKIENTNNIFQEVKKKIKLNDNFIR